MSIYTYDKCLAAYTNSQNYKFDRLLSINADALIKRRIDFYLRQILDGLYYNCYYNANYYDLEITNLQSFILFPLKNGDTVDVINGYFMRKTPDKDYPYVYYEGAPKFITELYHRFKKIDYRFKIKELENTSTKYTIRISL